MRNLMRALTGAVAVLFLAAGTAVAQNVGTVDQEGDDHFATIDQATAGNVGHITQTGVAEDVATIDQQGIDNFATISQDQGSNPFATDIVGHIDQIGDGNVATTTQFDDWDATNLYATVYQEGDANVAHQDQNNPGGSIALTATVEQLGDGNFATQEQGNAGGADFHTAHIFQDGMNNVATQLQTGPVDNFSDISQVGDGNVAHVDQSGF